MTTKTPLPHQTSTSSDPKTVDNTGLVSATHTPSKLLAPYLGSPLRNHLTPHNSFSFYSRKTWQKKKPLEATIASPATEEEISAHNPSKEAEHIWNVAMDLGVTSGSMQKGYVPKLMEMEDRDTKEAERLGNRRTTP